MGKHQKTSGAPENGLVATHAIYHRASSYTSRQLSPRNESMGSKIQILDKSLHTSSGRNSPVLEITMMS